MHLTVHVQCGDKKFSMDKIMFLLIAMFIMVKLNTESTTNISSTVRFKVLVSVSRCQSSWVCCCIIDTFCPESVTWHHFLELCTLDIMHKNFSYLSKYPSCRSQGDVYIFNCAETGYFILHSEGGYRCRLTVPVPYSIIVCRLICMFLFN